MPVLDRALRSLDARRMSKNTDPQPVAVSDPVEGLLDTEGLAAALDDGRFTQFLDQIPIAIAVAELKPRERMVYVNKEFERLTGLEASQVEGKPWDLLPGEAAADGDDRQLSDVLTDETDYIGSFAIDHDGKAVIVDAWSNVIEDDGGTPVFHLIALVDATARCGDERRALEQQIREKDLLLNELQHRVKNNLQIITTLIRVEARNMPDDASERRVQRLASRVQSLAILYRTLSDGGPATDTVDLGIYLSQIASAVMQAHAGEGIRLDMKVDMWPVSINVAMPAGLVVNELMTNALKYAFEGKEGGTITLHSIVDDSGCRVIVSDDGVGFSEGEIWPKPGKLGMAILQSLRQNANAEVNVVSVPGKGVSVTILFARRDDDRKRTG